jgi:hypothetical protein
MDDGHECPFEVLDRLEEPVAVDSWRRAIGRRTLSMSAQVDAGRCEIPSHISGRENRKTASCNATSTYARNWTSWEALGSGRNPEYRAFSEEERN